MPSRRHPHWRAAGLVACLIAGAVPACRAPSEPPEPPPPKLWSELRAHAGSLLDARPLDTVDEATLDEGLGVRMRAWSAPISPVERDLFEPIGARAGLILSLQHDRTLLPSPYLTEPVRIATGERARALLARMEDEEASGVRRLGEWQEVVPAGTTLEMALRPPGRLGSPLGSSVRVGLAISVEQEERELLGVVGVMWEESRSLPDFQLAGSAIVLTQEEAAEQAVEDVAQRELVLLDERLEDPEAAVVALFPSPGTSHTVIVSLERSSEPAGMVERTAFELLLDFARARILESDGVSELVTRVESEAVVGWRTLREALGWPDRQRESIGYLARRTGARLAEDLVLIAPSDVLEGLAMRIRELPPSRLSASAEALGWDVEMAAIETLRPRIETPAWKPELDAILVRRYGAVGLDFASVEDLMSQSQNLAGLLRSIEEENWLRLESTSPADRVRAYDWLLRRGKAPAGYDPLADRASRRAVLRQAVRAAARSVDEEPKPTEGEKPAGAER